MKQATCSDLRGACDTIIVGDTPEDMAQNSRNHVMQMVEKGDKAHIDAVEAMNLLPPSKQQKWYEQFVASFDNLEDV